jgi:hypothetical protein
MRVFQLTVSLLFVENIEWQLNTEHRVKIEIFTLCYVG